MCVAGHSNENRHPKPQFVKPDMARAMNPAREVTFPNDQCDEVPPASFSVQFFPFASADVSRAIAQPKVCRGEPVLGWITSVQLGSIVTIDLSR
jgi:hypothetical protein